MRIDPRVWGFICTTAHPHGCAANVRDVIARARGTAPAGSGPRRVLVLGASTGYGLAARVAAAFGHGAATLGVFLEKPATARKPGSAGWYNAVAFEAEARAAGLVSASLNADAFADATRAQAIGMIHDVLGGPVDLVIHSLAAPQRRLPDSGETVRTALRPIGEAFVGTSIDTDNDRLCEVRVEPASDAEILDTVAVMGGDDWTRWMHALRDAGALADNARSVAFSYLGPELTWPIYRHGTIGRAKADLERAAQALNAEAGRDDFARVALLKSIVTQASAAIPVIPLYLSVVSRVLRARDLQEDALDQQLRLFRALYPVGAEAEGLLDGEGRWRLDQRELRDDVQAECMALWPRIRDDNLFELTDYAGYKREFLRLFGFARDDIDYAADVDIDIGDVGIRAAGECGS